MDSCHAVRQKGGLCGGEGIIWSRAAVDRLFSDGRDEFWRRVYRMPMQGQDDISFSCMMYDMNLSMMKLRPRQIPVTLLEVEREGAEKSYSTRLVMKHMLFHLAGRWKVTTTVY